MHPSSGLRRGVPAVCALLLLVAPGAGFSEARAVDRFDSVVLDAGHGGDDEGAKGPKGTLEKQVVLDVARRLAVELRAEGLKVVLTRDADAHVPLEERTHIANDARADLFLSIHANASRNEQIRGIETFFLSLEASDEAALRVAERENRAFGRGATLPVGGGDPLVAILGNLAADEYLKESQAFARMAQGRLTQVDSRSSRGVKQAPFVVLGGVQMPASLVEIGFITNARDERRLASAEGQRAIVQALTAAVLEYGRRHDALRGLGGPPARRER
jgi:N-acetylmuramoyl-L-alanine amidase